MKNRLPRAAAVVDNRAITLQQIALARDLRCGELQLSQQALFLGGRIVQRRKVFLRANQDVRGRLRADVLKGENLVIFIGDLGKNLFPRNLAKQAVGAHGFPPVAGPSSRRTTNGVNPSRLRSCSPNCRAASSPETRPTRTR